MINENIIPEMTNPLSRYWDQPLTRNILIDDKNALMTKDDFEKLLDYSKSNPSGIYEGKMWKSGSDEKWFLRWIGLPDNLDEPDMLNIYSREIILI